MASFEIPSGDVKNENVGIDNQVDLFAMQSAINYKIDGYFIGNK